MTHERHHDKHEFVQCHCGEYIAPIPGLSHRCSVRDEMHEARVLADLIESMTKGE